MIYHSALVRLMAYLSVGVQHICASHDDYTCARYVGARHGDGGDTLGRIHGIETSKIHINTFINMYLYVYQGGGGDSHQWAALLLRDGQGPGSAHG